jgi:O-antigen ligase
MPPNLAACLCVGFILWLFYCNAKEHPGVSAGLWVPTIWVAISASKPLVAWIYGNSSNGGNGGIDLNAADGSAIDRNVLLALIFSGLVILKRRRFAWGTFFAENGWLLVFYLFMLLSVLWSDYPFVALKRWIRNVGSIIMILDILTEQDPVQAIRQVFVRCAYILIPLSLLVMKYFLDIGVYYNPWTYTPSFCGITTDKNGLGRLAWVSGLFLVWSLDNPALSGWYKKIRSRWWEAIVLGLCMMVLVQSNSATSLVCFTAVVSVYFVARMRWLRRRPSLMISGALVFILMSFLFLGIPDLRKAVTESLGRKPDLTERTDVWAGAMALKTNPLVGVGFASFWLTRGAQEMGQRMQLGEAHNGYLENYLNTGLIGCALLLVVLLCAGRNTLRHIAADSPTGYLYAALFLGGILYNYTESALNDTSLVGFLIWQVATWHRLQSSVPATSQRADELPIGS